MGSQTHFLQIVLEVNTHKFNNLTWDINTYTMAPSGIQDLEAHIIIVDCLGVGVGVLEVRILSDEAMRYEPNHQSYIWKELFNYFIFNKFNCM